MMFSSEVFSFINVSNTFVDFMKNGLHEEYHFSRFWVDIYMDTGNEDIHENFNLKNISIREYNVGRNWRKKFKRIKFSKVWKILCPLYFVLPVKECTKDSPLRREGEDRKSDGEGFRWPFTVNHFRQLSWQLVLKAPRSFDLSAMLFLSFYYPSEEKHPLKIKSRIPCISPIVTCLSKIMTI